MQKEIQRESIDEELQNRLWTAIKVNILDHWQYGNPRESQTKTDVKTIVDAIWVDYLKYAIDSMPKHDYRNPQPIYDSLRQHYFASEWWEIFDLIEFILLKAPQQWASALSNRVNLYLEEENSAYRIVDKLVVEVSDENEIAEIESAIDQGTRSVKTHLHRAIELLSDRRDPDYRNSVKESISAVESACRTITGDSKGSIKSCLKVLEKNGNMHSAFKQALGKLFGYTSDEGGIRHSLTDDSREPSFSEAKFMLVACSAFINFLWTKAAESGIELPKN